MNNELHGLEDSTFIVAFTAGMAVLASAYFLILTIALAS